MATYRRQVNPSLFPKNGERILRNLDSIVAHIYLLAIRNKPPRPKELWQDQEMKITFYHPETKGANEETILTLWDNALLIDDRFNFATAFCSQSSHVTQHDKRVRDDLNITAPKQYIFNLWLGSRFHDMSESGELPFFDVESLDYESPKRVGQHLVSNRIAREPGVRSHRTEGAKVHLRKDRIFRDYDLS